jgi:hypothetical protein
MNHRCHARGCAVNVRPELLMCRKHWFMVPRKIQRAVWASYRPGQCDDMDASESWHEAADAAIGFVAASEGRALLAVEVSALNSAGYKTRIDGAGVLRVSHA